MNSFNKTEDAIFPMQAMLAQGFPCSHFMNMQHNEQGTECQKHDIVSPFIAFVILNNKNNTIIYFNIPVWQKSLCIKKEDIHMFPNHLIRRPAFQITLRKLMFLLVCYMFFCFGFCSILHLKPSYFYAAYMLFKCINIDIFILKKKHMQL